MPIIDFPRGAGLLYERYLAGIDVDAVGLDTTVPPGRPGAAQGLRCRAISTRFLLLTGGEAMIRAADAIVAALGRGPFVFNLGHGVLQKTPPKHVGRPGPPPAGTRHEPADRRRPVQPRRLRQSGRDLALPVQLVRRPGDHPHPRTRRG